MAGRSRSIQRLSNKIILAVVGLAVIIGVVIWFAYSQKSTPGEDTKTISTYAECIAASGSVIQETYPERCVTSTGEAFTNPDQTVSPLPQ